jgi:hypothetical protein
VAFHEHRFQPGLKAVAFDNALPRRLLMSARFRVKLPLASLLSESGDWHAVYRDQVAILFQLSAANKTTQESKGLPRLAGLEISSVRGESQK